MRIRSEQTRQVISKKESPANQVQRRRRRARRLRDRATDAACRRALRIFQRGVIPRGSIPVLKPRVISDGDPFDLLSS
jgi:hypothetical protein